MRQYRVPAFAALVAALAGLMILLWAQTASASVPQDQPAGQPGAAPAVVARTTVPFGGTDGAVTATPTTTPTCGGPGGTPGPWTAVSPAPVAAHAMGAGSDGTNVYAAGGLMSSPINAFARFNPVGNTWTSLAVLPDSVEAPSVVYAPITNKVYVFGGYSSAGNVNFTRIYDVAGGTWSAGAAMPSTRNLMASGYYNGKIYLAGGFQTNFFNSAQAQIWEYDPVANTWNTTRANMPQGVAGGAYGVVNGHFYVISGTNAGPPFTTVYDYDIAANTWASGANIPSGEYTPGSAVVNGRIWVFGGGQPFTNGGNALTAPAAITTATQIYDPATDTWSAGPNLTLGRNYLAGAGVGSYAVAVAGYTGGGDTNLTEISNNPSAPCTTATPVGPTATPVAQTPTPAATPTCSSGPSVWRTETPLAVARGYAAGAVVNNQFYVVSGFSGSAPDATVERFDPATNTWTTLAPIPTPISQARGAALGTKIYIAGGFNNGFGGATAGMQIYDTVTGLWSQGAPLPEVRSGAGVAAANGKIYIIAGYGLGFATRNTVYEYDPVANTYATRAAAPAAEGNIAVGVLGNLIYAVGGAGSFLHYAYDPVANTWATIAAGPTANHQTPGVFALAGELWVMGGTNGFNPYPANQQVQIYNPGTDSWRFGPAFNLPRYGASAAGALNGRGYVAAGIDASTSAFINSMESIAPAGACGTPTPTATVPPTATATAPPTNTVTTTATATDTPLPTATPRPASPTATSVPGSATATPTPVLTTCPVYFVDVPASDPFYAFVRCLTCRALLSGYPCGSPGEPCIAPDNQPYYRPNNDATRGQIAKILSNAAGYVEAIPSTQQTFEDVHSGDTFWVQVERIAGRGFISGYPCGGPTEPCVAPGNRPYFRPNNPVTRGQLAKMDALTAGWTETPTSQTFEDVPPGSTFYVYTERLATRGVIAGYPCGGGGEPCIAPGNRAYFRTYTNVTRAQTAKIIANSFFPNCQTPVRQP